MQKRRPICQILNFDDLEDLNELKQCDSTVENASQEFEPIQVSYRWDKLVQKTNSVQSNNIDIILKLFYSA